MALRHEADVLAVVLLRNRKIEPPRQLAHLLLGVAAKRKADETELGGGSGKQKITLVAPGIPGAIEPARAVGLGAGLHVVPSRQRVGAEIARNIKEIGEFDLLVAGDAGHRRRSAGIPLCKGNNDALAETGLEVEDVMGNAKTGGDVAGIAHVAAGTASLAARDSGAVVVKLHGDADDIIALLLEQSSHHGRIHASGHGHNNARVRGWLG